MNRGLLTIRASWSETAVAGTASAVLADTSGWDRDDIKPHSTKVPLTKEFGGDLKPKKGLMQF
jgi:hypothetical protein